MAGFMIFIKWILAWWALWRSTGADPTIVTISSGKYQGEQRGYYYAFEGIPYAEPPTGQNRFEPPKSYNETWDEIRLVREMSPQCMQWDNFSPLLTRLKGAEDCLYMNIYIPASVRKSGEKAPVIFFIHGG